LLLTLTCYGLDQERLEFISWLAGNPGAGGVVPGSGGCPEVRWSRGGAGKRGGSRVIYFTRWSSVAIWLLMGQAKSGRDNISGHLLKAVRKEIDNGWPYYFQACFVW